MTTVVRESFTLGSFTESVTFLHEGQMKIDWLSDSRTSISKEHR